MRCQSCDRTGYYGVEMFYDNNLPLSELCQEWMETEVRPDWWDWHEPGEASFDFPFPVETQRLATPAEPERAYHQFICWLVKETAFDQLFRRPQVSHQEIKFIWDWLLTIEEADGTLQVSGYLQGQYGITMPLEYCCWHSDTGRYPPYILSAFKVAGWDLHPTNVTNDPRHPHHQSYLQQYRKPRLITPTPKETTHVVAVESTGNPHRDMLNELMRD